MPLVRAFEGVQVPVKDDTNGAPWLFVRDARSENRVVGENGSGADCDGREQTAPAHDVRERLFAGDPAGGASAGGDASIKGGSALGNEKGGLFVNPVIEDEIEVRAFFVEDAYGYVDSMIAEDGNRLAVVQGIWIHGSDDNPSDTGC